MLPWFIEQVITLPGNYKFFAFWPDIFNEYRELALLCDAIKFIYHVTLCNE